MKQLKYFFYFLEKQGVKSNGSYFRQKIGPYRPDLERVSS